MFILLFASPDDWRLSLLKHVHMNQCTPVKSARVFSCMSVLCVGYLSALQIPDMLGVVLSSSKYGVRQARGKYGMGAKMALIWSKKSTGLPIQVGVLCGSVCVRARSSACDDG